MTKKCLDCGKGIECTCAEERAEDEGQVEYLAAVRQDDEARREARGDFSFTDDDDWCWGCDRSQSECVCEDI